MLNVDNSEKLDTHPIDGIVEEFGRLEEQLNIFKESIYRIKLFGYEVIK